MEIGFDGKILIIGNEFIGFNLGADATTEHEVGIKPLMADFGLQFEKELGFEARRNTVVPKGLEYREDGEVSKLAYSPRGEVESAFKWLSHSLAIFEENEFISGWSDRDFGIGSDKYKKAVHELYTAFERKDGIIMLGKAAGLLANRGLNLLIYSQIPQDAKDEFRHHDKQIREQKELCKRFEQESGVIELLKQKGKQWFALSVREIKDGKPIWFLNPYEQDKDNYGWFTTEDLIALAEDKGPIVMEKSKCS